MKKFKKMEALIFALLLVFGISVKAYAHDIPQMDKKGKISVSMQLEGKAVGGGTLTMYRVGEIDEENGNYSFVQAGDFVNFKQSFIKEEVESPELAAKLAKYSSDEKISGETKNIGTDGKIIFSDLELGLYLFVQNKAADGCEKVAPFLVTLPYMEEGVYKYEVDASPKVEIKKDSSSTTRTESTTKTDKDNQGKLPQTGQLKWPIPILVVAGLSFFMIGWMLCFGKRRKNEE